MYLSLLNEANKKIINIDGIDGKWKINSNNNVKIIAPNVIDIYGKNVSKSQLRDNVVSTVNLREYMMQYVYVENTSEIYVLYCSPILEDYMCLDIKKSSEILKKLIFSSLILIFCSGIALSVSLFV